MVIMLVLMTFILAIMGGIFVRHFSLRKEISMIEARDAKFSYRLKEDEKGSGDVDVLWLPKGKLGFSPAEMVQNPIQFPKDVYYHRGMHGFNLMDSFQFRVFFDQVKAKLRAAISHPTLGMVYGDGEVVIRGIADQLDEKLWRIVVSQLFHSKPD